MAKLFRGWVLFDGIIHLIGATTRGPRDGDMGSEESAIK